MASSSAEPSIRVIIQQCLSAKLQVQLASAEQNAKWVEVNRGIVLLVCFLKGASIDMIPKTVKSVLNVKLSETSQGNKVSVLDLPGDVLIVPQATLGGKMKGKSMQYHSNIEKSEALALYQEFVSLCEKAVATESRKTPDNQTVPQVKWGTYGNRQVLSMSTNGPYTHIMDF